MTSILTLKVFERGEETDSVAEEDNEDEQFDEDAELYNNVLRKLLPGTKFHCFNYCQIIVGFISTDKKPEYSRYRRFS